MKRLTLILVLLLLTSCASTSTVHYKPRSGSEYVTASWYGPKFNGRPTASGERFDMHGLTAAHKTMKFGTELKVTNPENGRSVVVTVNDRGPFIRGRDLDLSYGAAKKIGLVKKGVGKVKIEYLGRNDRYMKRIPFMPSGGSGLLTVQVGSFTEKSNAERLKRGLEADYENTHITTVLINGKKYYRVNIGKFTNYDRAYAIAEKLADEGYHAMILAKKYK
jgi:rare lipoprotein A